MTSGLRKVECHQNTLKLSRTKISVYLVYSLQLRLGLGGTLTKVIDDLIVVHWHCLSLPIIPGINSFKNITDERQDVSCQFYMAKKSKIVLVNCCLQVGNAIPARFFNPRISGFGARNPGINPGILVNVHLCCFYVLLAQVLAWLPLFI